MNEQAANSPNESVLAARRSTVFADFWELAKPEITFHVTISALAGFALGAPAINRPLLLVWALAGTALCSAGGGVLNHFVERHHDARMRRTANRPIPSGRISPIAALTYGLILLGMGLTALSFTNLLTVVLAALTVLLYLLAYTPLKRRTRFNTLVGTIPGALPALGGYTAAAGAFGAPGWALFAILAFWQMPHFLSLAWMYRKDYARAEYVMLPVVSPDGRSTGLQTLLYTLALGVASIIPTLLGDTGWIYLFGITVLSVWFVFRAYAFYRSLSVADAKRVLKASVLYIPVLVAFIFMDRWIS